MLLSGREPLSWATRVQIALDSARGLEYIHEHTVPVYIHRDIKPANILIDINFRAKVVIIFSGLAAHSCFDFFFFPAMKMGFLPLLQVADFGLAKLTEVGSASLHTRLVGTFGYMPPEYDISFIFSPSTSKRNKNSNFTTVKDFKNCISNS